MCGVQKDVQDNAASQTQGRAADTLFLRNFTLPVCVPAPPGVFEPELFTGGTGRRLAKTGAQVAVPTRLFDVIVAATHDPIPGTVQTDSTLVSCSNSEGEDVYA